MSLESAAFPLSLHALLYVYNPRYCCCLADRPKAGLHFILGLYLCVAGNKPGAHHLYIIPVWLIACAGVWAGVVYYFASVLDVVIKFPDVEPLPEQPLWTTWVKVGTATAALNVLLDFAMLGFFILDAVKKTSKKTLNISAPIYNQPQVCAPQLFDPFRANAASRWPPNLHRNHNSMRHHHLNNTNNTLSTSTRSSSSSSSNNNNTSHTSPNHNHNHNNPNSNTSSSNSSITTNTSRAISHH
jgi:hypothetical protein